MSRIVQRYPWPQKTRGIDAEREKEKQIAALSSSINSCAKQLRTKKNISKTDQKIGHLQSFLVRLRIITSQKNMYRFQQHICACECDEAFAQVYVKVLHPRFPGELELSMQSIFRQFSDRVRSKKTKNSPVQSTKSSRYRVLHTWYILILEKQHPRNKMTRYLLKRGKLL